MDNIEAGTLLLECGIFIRAMKDVRLKIISKFNNLERRLVVNKETSQSLYNEIRSFHQELGINNGT